MARRLARGRVSDGRRFVGVDRRLAGGVAELDHTAAANVEVDVLVPGQEEHARNGLTRKTGYRRRRRRQAEDDDRRRRRRPGRPIGVGAHPEGVHGPDPEVVGSGGEVENVVAGSEHDRLLDEIGRRGELVLNLVVRQERAGARGPFEDHLGPNAGGLGGREGVFRNRGHPGRRHHPVVGQIAVRRRVRELFLAHGEIEARGGGLAQGDVEAEIALLDLGRDLDDPELLGDEAVAGQAELADIPGLDPERGQLHRRLDLDLLAMAPQFYFRQALGGARPRGERQVQFGEQAAAVLGLEGGIGDERIIGRLALVGGADVNPLDGVEALALGVAGGDRDRTPQVGFREQNRRRGVGRRNDPESAAEIHQPPAHGGEHLGDDVGVLAVAFDHAVDGVARLAGLLDRVAAGAAIGQIDRDPVGGVGQ